MSSTPLSVCEQKTMSVLGLLPDSHGIKQGHLHCQVQPEQGTASDHHKVVLRDMGRKITLSGFIQFLLNQILTDPTGD